jgi:hypothetical protein
MPEGVIVGGWSYIVAAYLVVGAGLLAYAVSLMVRLHRATERPR